MNNYRKVVFRTDAKLAEMLMAELAELGFDSFEQKHNEVIGYIPDDLYNNLIISEINLICVKYSAQMIDDTFIEAENWNAVWESNYPPVRFGNFCFIHAPFHEKATDVAFDIVIEPKMSFGTAHHETTAMMIEWLEKLDVKDKSVLDMGCGTAVLAILAKMKGAKDVLGIDNDEWAFENSLENVQNNNVEVDILLGDAEILPKNEKFDLIIANINRNILINDMKNYANAIKKGGNILFSGFYEHDMPFVLEAAEKFGITYQEHLKKNNWVAVKTCKLHKSATFTTVKKQTNGLDSIHGNGVIFDMDGTLVNNLPYHIDAFLELHKRHGMPTMLKDDFLKYCNGRTNNQIMRFIFGEQLTDEECAIIDKEKEQIYRDIYRPFLKLSDGLEKIIQQLYDAGIPMAVGSSAGKDNIDFVLDGLNIRKYFKAIVHQEMVSKGKPNPEVFLKCAAALGIPPEKCIVFEDAISGVEAGKRAGCKVIAITSSMSVEEFNEATFVPDKIISDFEEISFTGIAE
ncbi:MAG: 50S ribosomal protein L11 methyltransferase [Bacteroidales bacterium]|jgi:ribosomal protein L11 methyltransferase|nr:50S ribosomal protein L11 methyltransferase [Bacteroidales bacterium]